MLNLAKTLKLNSLKQISRYSSYQRLTNRSPFLFRSTRLFSTASSAVMNLSSIVNVLESIAPSSTAEPWDNVGLLIEPSSLQNINHIFLTIDLTEAVLNEAIQYKEAGDDVGLIVSYHPPIFKPFKRLTQRSAKERIIIKSIESGIGIYSPHTAHDSLWGGVNDWILRAFEEGGTVIPLSISESNCSLPIVLSISSLLDRAMCKEISEYLTTVSHGSIDGDSITVTTNETVSGSCSYSLKCSLKKDSINNLLPKLTEDYPHYKLSISSQPKVPYPGPGRLIKFNTPCPLDTLISQIKTHLGLSHIRIARSKEWEEGKLASSLAVCVGSGASVLHGIKADVYLTGEMSHHEVLEATSKGIAVVLCEHTNTERGFLRVFKKLIEDRVPTTSNVKVTISQVDRDPLNIV